MRQPMLAALAALLLASGVHPQEAAPKPKDEPIAIETVKLDRPADFKIDVFPALRSNCIACHNAKDAEGDVILETPKTMLQGGENGPAIVPGKADQSLLLKVASLRKKPHMPPADNKAGAKRLTPRELGLIKLWIDQGAKGSSTPVLDAPQFQPVAASWNPIYAVALDAEGRLAACGRGGRLHVYQLATRRMDELADPKLGGFAHRDAVQAIALSPDGALLATGGYRSIKIWKREHPGRTVTVDAGGAVKAAAFSPDGARLALEAGDAVKIVETASGKAVAAVKGTAPRFSPDGALLLTLSPDKTVRLWKTADGAEAGRLETAASAADFASGGTQVVTGGEDGLVRVWPLPGKADAPAPKPARELKGHKSAIVDVRPLPGKAGGLASASQEGHLIVWNPEGDKSARELKTGSPVTGIAVSPDGKRLLAVGAASARLWGETAKEIADLKTDGPARRNEQTAAALAAFAAAEVKYREGLVKAAEDHKKKEEDEAKKAAEGIAPLEKDAKDKEEAAAKAVKDRESADQAVGAADKAIAAAKARQEAAAKKTPPEDAPRKAAEKAFIESGKAHDEAKAKAEAAAKALAEAKDDAKEKAAAEKKKADDALAQAQKKRDEARAAAETAATDLEKAKKAFDAERAAVEPALKEADAKKKDAEKKQQEAKKAEETATAAANQSKQNLESARRRAAKAKDEVVAAEKAIGEAKHRLEAQKKDLEKADVAKKASTEAVAKSASPIRSAGFTADGALVVLGSEAGRVFLFGSEKGEDAGILESHTKPVLAVGGALLSAAADGSIRSGPAFAGWKLERTIEPADPAQAPVDRVTALAFSPDGKTLASGGGVPSREGELVLWNPADGKPVRTIADAHSDTVYAVAFSPDGTRLATSGADKFAKVWTLASGKLVRSFEGHTGHVLGVSWNRTGRTIATAGADGAVKVWSLETGQQIKSIPGFDKQVTSLRHLGFDDRLAVAAGGAQLRIVRENGSTEKNLEGAGTFLYAVAATADGRLVASGGLDGTLRVWKSDGGAPVAVFAPAASK